MAAEHSNLTPLHSIDECPVCGCGLCGIRICGYQTDEPHGLIVCDECEALWIEPDTCSPHVFRNSENPCCPICGEALWSSHSRWAYREDLARLGWLWQADPALSTEEAALSADDAEADI